MRYKIDFARILDDIPDFFRSKFRKHPGAAAELIRRYKDSSSRAHKKSVKIEIDESFNHRQAR